MRPLRLALAFLIVAAGTAAAQNLLTNGSFNGNLNGWVNDPQGQASFDAAHDATGLGGSGSVKTLAPAGKYASLSQCVAVIGSTLYKAGGKVYIPAGQGIVTSAGIALNWFADSICQEYVSSDQSLQVVSAPNWVATKTLSVNAPADARSVSFAVNNYGNQNPQGSPAAQVNFDDLFLTGLGGAASSRWVPAVIHQDVPAKNAKWRTDVAVVNRSQMTANLSVTIFAPGVPLTKKIQVGPGSQLVLTDVAAWLGVTTNSGALEVASDQDFCMSARTYNQVDATHTYGQDYEGQLSSEMLAAGGTATAWLPQLTENSLFRTNVGITNTGPTPANVTLTLFDTHGAQLWTDTRDYAPGAFYQYQQPYRNVGGITDGFAVVTVNSGTGVVAYASVIDANTGDPTTVSMKK